MRYSGHIKLWNRKTIFKQKISICFVLLCSLKINWNGSVYTVHYWTLSRIFIPPHLYHPMNLPLFIPPFLRDCTGKVKGSKETETWESQTLNDTYKTSIWCSCLEKLISNCLKSKRKFIYIKFCIKVVGLNRSYSTNAKPIGRQFNPTGVWNLRFNCSYYNFLFFIFHFE